MAKQLVVLEVEYDEAQVDAPAYWSWNTLTREQVRVMAVGAVDVED